MERVANTLTSKIKIFSLINIMGLTTGICVVSLTRVWVYFKDIHDRYNCHAGYIYTPRDGKRSAYARCWVFRHQYHDDESCNEIKIGVTGHPIHTPT